MSEELGRLYPSLDTVKEQALLDKLSFQRAEMIKSKYKELEASLKHYKKLKKRWSKVSNIIRISGISIGSLFGSSAIVIGALTTSGIALPTFIPLVLGGITIVDEVFAECALRTYAKSKKHHFSNKIDIIQKYLNRLFHLEQKIIDDNKITIPEMELYSKLIDEYESDFKEKNNSDDTFKLNSKLEKEAFKEAKKEVFSETKEKLKKEIKTKLQSSVST